MMNKNELRLENIVSSLCSKPGAILENILGLKVGKIKVGFNADLVSVNPHYEIFIDEELNIQPTFMCCNPKFNPTISINNERLSNKRVSTLPAILGIALIIMSIETKPPHLYADGAIKPVIQSIKNLAASSGHGNALFKTYLKNT